MNATIPSAIHICPGCNALASGELYCASCRERSAAWAKFHAARAHRLYSALPRAMGIMPEVSRRRRLKRQFVITVRIAIVLAWAAILFDLYRLFFC